MTPTQTILAFIGLIAWSLLCFWIGVKHGKEQEAFDQETADWLNGKNRPQL